MDYGHFKKWRDAVTDADRDYLKSLLGEDAIKGKEIEHAAIPVGEPWVLGGVTFVHIGNGEVLSAAEY